MRVLATRGQREDWMAGCLRLRGRAVGQANQSRAARAARGSQAGRRSSTLAAEMMTSLWGADRLLTDIVALSHCVLGFFLVLLCPPLPARQRGHGAGHSRPLHARLAAWGGSAGEMGVVPGGVRLVPIDPPRGT